MPIFGMDEAGLTALRESRLRETLNRVFVAHPHYRARFAAAGLRRQDISGLADLPRLPVTTKADYAADPEGFVLGPEGAADDSETIVWDAMYTTGSSGRPAPFVSTAYDFVNILAVQRNMLALRSIGPDDHILNLFPLTRHPHGAFARAMNAAAAFGIPVTAALPGQANARRPEIGHRLDEVVAIAARVQPTILWGVPTYIRKVVARAAELGARLPTVRMVFVTGEGFGEEARADLLDRLRLLGASARISVSYGATEMQGGMVECTHGSGYHNPAPDQFLFETVDPDTYQPVPEGEEGLLLLTHLDRRGTVLLRYALGDVARMARGRCPHCGALTERLTSIPHRVDGLVKIRGMLVNPQALVEAVMAEPAVVEFQAVVAKERAADPLSMDVLTLHAVPAAGPDGTLAVRVAERVRRACGITPVVTWTTSEDPLLAGRGWKAKPVLDMRPAAI